MNFIHGITNILQMMYFSMIGNIKHILFSKKRYPYLIFFIISFVPFFWHNNLFSSDFIGSADYLSPYVTAEWISQTTSVYGPQVGGGADYAYLAAYFFLYNLPVRLLHTLGMSGPMISITILSGMLFISQVSMFALLKYVLHEKLFINNIPTHLLAAFGGIFFGFSPYLPGIIAPGHIFQIYSYMVFPLLLMFVDRFLSSKNYSWKNLIVLYYAFFLSSPAYANIGILYVTFFIIGMYYVFFVLLKRSSIVTSTLKTILVVLSALVANIWWILPYIANFGQAIAINQASTIINEAISAAVKDATMVNIFFGRAESLYYHSLNTIPFLNMAAMIMFTGIIILAFIPLILKGLRNGYVYILSLFLFVGAFITKGPNDPFGFIFNWLYFTIPGFQVFRRPVSKFYWFFLLILFILAIIGAGMVLHRTKRKLISHGIITFLSIVCVFFVITFIKTPLLVTFDVPKYYSQAKDYLDKTEAQRILLLPGFYGTYPTYNKSINNYYGVDFVPFIIPYQFVEPNNSEYGVGSPTKNAVNDIVSLIKNNKPFCYQTSRLGISHILLRQDIDIKTHTEGTSEEFISYLQHRPEIASSQSFQKGNDGIIIFTLNENCKGSKIVSTNDSTLLHDTKMQFSEIRTTIKRHSKATELSLKQNETEQWRAYIVPKHQLFIPPAALLGVYQEAEKIPSDDGIRNTWKLPPSTDDTHIVLYYQSQLYFLIGLAVFYATNISIISLVLYAHAQRSNKKSRE